MPYKVTSQLPKILEDFLGKLGVTQTLMGLLLAGLFAVAFGVVALVVGLLLGRVAARPGREPGPGLPRRASSRPSAPR
ncbi:hypothetical protein [Nonomuraea dietziae]|uniref:hypothetical protein n=1 Tax=Nonomuraea dietziae TaxID=65515 RepID=UPI0031E30AAE